MQKIQGHHAFRVDYNSIPRELSTPIIVSDFQRKSNMQVEAIWDTGATNSVITKKIVEALGLIPTGQTIVRGVNSENLANTYLINIVLPNRIQIAELNVTECNINNCDMLIGMDVISLGDFTISNHGQKTLFCFSIPPHHNKIDLVEKSIKSNKRSKIMATA